MNEIGSFIGADDEGTEYEVAVFVTAHSNLQGHFNVYTYFCNDEIALKVNDGTGNFKLRDRGIIISPRTAVPEL
ncbi:hypothetical protein [Duganella sp. LjRoot269]|uniref:hypothetical protein n=1 Tax=Duganella sp. LjRoot269 TaxID=3342305 RepID=UPI003ECD4DA8